MKTRLFVATAIAVVIAAGAVFADDKDKKDAEVEKALSKIAQLGPGVHAIKKDDQAASRLASWWDSLELVQCWGRPRDSKLPDSEPVWQLPPSSSSGSRRRSAFTRSRKRKPSSSWRAVKKTTRKL